MEGVATCSQYPDRRKKYRKRSFDDKAKHQPAKHVCRMERRIHRLGGSVSDPLNLEGLPDDFECPTCVPSPSDGHRRPGDQPSPLPSQLHGDPLNLEEKVSDYSLVVAQCQHHQSSDERRKKDQKKKRHRTTQRSKSHSESSEELNQIQSSSNFNPKAVTYRYGNYDKYYGYRNPGSYQDDLRLKLLQKEWFEGKRCLDIGSNTGHLTAAIAHSFAPSRITGIDIDKKLVRIAWKNLYRHTVPVVAPDGRAFPKSFVMSCGPLVPQNLSPTSSDDTGFPKNVEYIEGNYVPASEVELEAVEECYDVILCLSLTKWVHLNWGDDGVKLMFRKTYLNLRPGGRLILEPQSWSSYARRKKLTPDIFHNYQNITFRPEQFHTYLMSPAVGFTEHQFLGIPDNKSKGFKRPIHMYIKTNQPAPPPTLPPPPSSAEAGQEAGKKEAASSAVSSVSAHLGALP